MTIDSPLAPPAEPVLRRLRTVLDEARGLLQVAGGGEALLVLGESIEQVQNEAAALAPNFYETSVQNGPSHG